MKAMRGVLVAQLAAISVAAATVELQAIHHRPVEAQLFGLNSILGTIYTLPFDDPVVLNVIKTLRVGSWRYPGGTVANYFDITQGNYLASCSESNCSCCANRPAISSLLPPGALAGAAFTAPNAVGSNLQSYGPIWDLNVFLMSSEESANQIDYLNQTVGYERVEFIELGNEFYLPPYRWRLPTVGSYIQQANATIQRAQHTFPDARIAVVASAIHDYSDHGGCGDSWNQDLAASVPNTIKDFTMHDYSIGNSTVMRVSGDWQKVAYTMAYSDAVMANASIGAKMCFGDDISIWQTEYNYAAGNGAGFDHKHGPLFGDRVNGTIHGVYLASRMIHAVTDPTYKAIDFMCALAVEGVGWGGHSGIIGLEVDWDSKPVPKVTQANVTGMAQIYAHLSYLAARTEGTVTMAGLVQPAGSGPLLNVSLDGTTDLPCLQGALFLGADGANGAPKSYGVAIINRCPDDITTSLPVAPSSSPSASSTSYSGTIAIYDTEDQGGSVPIPDESEPFPWANGPLQMTKTVAVSGAMPQTLTVPGLTMVMGKLTAAGQ